MSKLRASSSVSLANNRLLLSTKFYLEIHNDAGREMEMIIATSNDNSVTSSVLLS